MREKKSESLEVRLPHKLKQAFMDRCRAEGRPASEVVRQMIEAYLARPQRPSSSELPLMLRPKIAIPTALAASVAVGALFAASTSQAGPDLREAFNALDKDRNGAVTLAEFNAGAQDRVVFVGTPHAKVDGPRLTVPLTKTPELDRAVAAAAKANRAPLGAGLFYNIIDADRSGSVDFAEYVRHHERVRAESFASLDLDKDGRITGDEFWRPTQAARDLPALNDSLRQTFVRLDADNDGAISRSEFAAF